MRSKLTIAGLMIFLSLLAGLIYWSPVQTGDTQSFVERAAAPQTEFGKVQAFFEANMGQHDPAVRFKAHTRSGYSLFLTATDAVYIVPERKKDNDLEKGKAEISDDSPSREAAVWMKLNGADPNSRFTGLNELPGKVNYIRGETHGATRTNISTYQSVRMEDVYQGIDVVWRGIAADKVQYDFMVKPNADPGLIEWKIEGADSVSLNDAGDILIATPFGTIRQQKPYSYQETDGVKTEVASRFTLDNNSVRFQVDDYDRAKTLVIDPYVELGNGAFSTFLGGSGADAAYATAVDKVGNVYVTGGTSSSGFPTTSGAYDTGHNSNEDVFVTKLNRAGNGLIYSTFIGGSDFDRGIDIFLEPAGTVIVAGRTRSNPYPTTAGAYDTTFNGLLNDAFVTKLNAAGTALVFSTYFGGTDFDEITGVTADSSGNVYVTGYTFSSTNSFPTTGGAFQTVRIGESDAFVGKFNAAGSSLTYCSLLGGDAHSTAGSRIAVNSSGNAFIVGYTWPDASGPFPTPFPTTSGAYDTTANGGFDVFLTKFNTTGTALSYSTLIGGSGDDLGWDLALDSSGNAFITGEAADDSTDYPTTGGVYDTTANGSTDVFITKFNSTGTALGYSTFIGPGLGRGIALDDEETPYITAFAFNSYPTTVGAFDDTYGGGGSDAAITRLKDGSDLVYSTFIGGSNVEGGYDIALDSFGSAIIAGATDGQYYPTIAGSYDTSYNGGNEAVVTKLGCNCPKPIADYDGDNKTDLSTFRPSNGNWYISNTLGSYNVSWGSNGDIITPGDYDADGKTDLAIFRPSTGYWWIFFSSTATYTATLWGTNGDIPVQADYDGDGKTDLAYWRPSDGKWYIVSSLTGGTSATTFGTSGDRPAVGDYDGDGKSDLAVFRPSDTTWYVTNVYLGYYTFSWGLSTDLITPADYDGDGRTDFAIFRPSTGYWWIYSSLNDSYYSVGFGSNGDIPVPGNYDGDTKADTSFWRPSDGKWYLITSTNNGQPTPVVLGTSGDIPTPSTYVR